MQNRLTDFEIHEPTFDPRLSTSSEATPRNINIAKEDSMLLLMNLVWSFVAV